MGGGETAEVYRSVSSGCIVHRVEEVHKVLEGAGANCAFYFLRIIDKEIGLCADYNQQLDSHSLSAPPSKDRSSNRQVKREPTET